MPGALRFVLKTSPPRPCGLSAIAEAFPQLPVTLGHTLRRLALIASASPRMKPSRQRINDRYRFTTSFSFIAGLIDPVIAMGCTLFLLSVQPCLTVRFGDGVLLRGLLVMMHLA